MFERRNDGRTASDPAGLNKQIKMPDGGDRARPYDGRAEGCEAYEKMNDIANGVAGLGPSPEWAQRELERQIRDRFSYHPPRPEQVQRYQMLRDDFTALAVRIGKHTQPGSDRDTALEALHIAMMLANRAIALEN